MLHSKANAQGRLGAVESCLEVTAGKDRCSARVPLEGMAPCRCIAEAQLPTALEGAAPLSAGFSASNSDVQSWQACRACRRLKRHQQHVAEGRIADDAVWAIDCWISEHAIRLVQLHR